MVAMTTDVIAITNDHAWTDNDDVTTPTTSEQPHPGHPSEKTLDDFNKNAKRTNGTHFTRVRGGVDNADVWEGDVTKHFSVKKGVFSGGRQFSEWGVW